MLLAATALLLLVGVIQLLIPGDFRPGFLDRASASFCSFINLDRIGCPLLAVLLATHLRPVVGRARLITLVALIEYAVSAFFGVIFGLPGASRTPPVTRPGWRSTVCWAARRTSVVFGVAAYAVFRVVAGASTRRRSRAPARRSTASRAPYGQPSTPAVWPAAYHVRPADPYGQPGGYGQPGPGALRPAGRSSGVRPAVRRRRTAADHDPAVPARGGLRRQPGTGSRAHGQPGFAAAGATRAGYQQAPRLTAGRPPSRPRRSAHPRPPPDVRGTAAPTPATDDPASAA